MQSDAEVLYTTEFGEQARQYLAAGKKVVLTPAPNKVKGRKSTFHNHFWNPIMFAWAPMTIGCLIHADATRVRRLPDLLPHRLAVVGHPGERQGDRDAGGPRASCGPSSR